MEPQSVATLFVSVGATVLSLCLIGMTLKILHAISFVQRSTLPRPQPAIPDEVDPPSNSVSCYVCMAKPATAALVDCGHVGMCSECATRVWASTRMCPLCRKPIQSVTQVEIVTMN